MVLPFITSISRDVFEDRAAGAERGRLRRRLHDLGSGRNVVLPYTRVGVIGGVMLALGRALGETMAVTFIIGNAFRSSSSVFCAGHDDLGQPSPANLRGDGISSRRR
jgi:phosphate transport system permease protein